MTTATDKFVDRQTFLIKRRMLFDKYWPKLGFSEPFPQQAAAWEAWLAGAIFMMIVAGRRGAKTGTAAATVIAEAAFPPFGALPKRLINHTAPTFGVTDRVGEYIWNWVVNKKIFGLRPKKISERERRIELPWACKIEGKTCENPDSLLGSGNVETISDEHARIKKGVMEQYMIPPLSDATGCLWIASTPKGRRNHLYKTYLDWKAKMESGDPRYYVGHWTSYDNPYHDHSILREYEESCRRTDQMELYNQEILAEFTSISGAIYKRFTPTKGIEPWHVGNIDYIPDREVYIGIDWGYDHPFVAVFGQLIEGDRLRVFDVISKSGLEPNEQVHEVRKTLRKYWYDGNIPDVEMLYCDPSDPGNKKLFRKADFPVYAAPKKPKIALNARGAGITEVKSLLARTVKPGLQIDVSCDTLISGIESYEWDDNENPIKEQDDEVDALRYLVMGTVGMKNYVPDPFF